MLLGSILVIIQTNHSFSEVDSRAIRVVYQFLLPGTVGDCKAMDLTS